MSSFNGVIVGETGTGKSALTNAVSDKTDCEEGSSSFSITKGTKAVEFFIDMGSKKILYRIMDTQGVCDTEDDPVVVAENLSKGIEGMAQHGPINHVLAVFSGRIEKKKVANLEKVLKQIFGDECLKYVTSIKTHCEYYEDTERTEKERKKLQADFPLFSYFFENMIFVDNVPSFYDKGLSDKHRQKTRNVLHAYLASHLNSGFYPDMVKAKQRIQAEKKKQQEALEAEQKAEKTRKEAEAFEKRQREEQEKERARRAQALEKQRQETEAAQRARDAARPPPPVYHHHNDDDCVVL